MNLFARKNIRPMLIGLQEEPFDDADYLYELKLDGIRCIAYLDETGTDLRNKRNLRLLPKVPELSELHKQVKGTCILDGELAVIWEGRTDFYEIQKRVMTENALKIRLAAGRCPACFTAFDLLYLDGKETAGLPLLERKELLASAIRQESPRFACTRWVEGRGKALFALTKERGLEGIVAKKKDSRYYFDRRTKDWIKCKIMVEEDFLICGYLRKERNMTSLVLGRWEEGRLTYQGHVTLGVSRETVERIARLGGAPMPFAALPPGNETAIWVQPCLVCTVEYMAGETEGRRQAVFRGIREGLGE